MTNVVQIHHLESIYVTNATNKTKDQKEDAIIVAQKQKAQGVKLAAEEKKTVMDINKTMYDQELENEPFNVPLGAIRNMTESSKLPTSDEQFRESSMLAEYKRINGYRTNE